MEAPARPRIQARRSRLEEMMDILMAVKEDAEKPTRIMYRANLSWTTSQGLLKRLAEKGLLKSLTNGARRRYELTEKGGEALYHYALVVDAVEETGVRWPTGSF